MALMSNIIDSEPSNYEEAINQQVWRDAMVDYNSIIKNDVWDIVPRSKGKSVMDRFLVSSKGHLAMYISPFCRKSSIRIFAGWSVTREKILHPG